MGAEMTDLDLVAALLGRNQTLFLRSVFLLLDSATLAACLAVTPAWRAFIRAQLLGSPRIFPRVLARAWRDVAGYLPIFYIFIFILSLSDCQRRTSSNHAAWEQVLVPGSITSVAADGDSVLVSCTSGHVARLPGDTCHVTEVAACPGEEGDTWTSSVVGVGGGLVLVTRWGRDRGEAVVVQLEVRRREDMGLLHTVRRRKPDKNFSSILSGNSVFIRYHISYLIFLWQL